jgi:NADPH2:quinone reductase
VDNIGGASFLTLARLMRWNGRLVPMGFVSGEIPSLPMNLPLLKNYSVVGVFAGAWMTNFPDQAAQPADKIMALVGDGKLRPRIDRVLPLEQAAEAMRSIADRTVQGRIVLEVK